MISLPSGTRIWLVAGVTDMRKSFNGLGEQVQHVLNDNPFRRDSYSGQPSVIHTTTSKADSRLRRRSSVARVRSPKTCATTVLRILSYA